MKKFIKKSWQIICNLIFVFINKFGHKYADKFFKAICIAYAKKGNYFYTYNIRLKLAENIVFAKLKSNAISQFAIIIQGPLMKEDNFTIETIKLYKILFPSGILIVSTWNDTDQILVHQIEKLGAKVILSDYPEINGVHNINYQVVSSKAGLEYAKKLGVKYALKTRSDQRLNRKNLYEFFCGLLNQFPCGNGYQNLNQNKRIIVSQGAVGSFFIPFHICDWLYFGDIDDLLNLFNMDLDQRKFNDRNEYFKYENIHRNKENMKVGEFFNLIAPEAIIFAKYLHKNGCAAKLDTIQEYWKFVKHYLICVSANEIDLYWNKYKDEMVLENNITTIYNEFDNNNYYATYSWTFANWFNLYTGMVEYTCECERIAQLAAKRYGQK